MTSSTKTSKNKNLYSRFLIIFKRFLMFFELSESRTKSLHRGRIFFIGVTTAFIMVIFASRYAYLTLVPSDLREKLLSQDSRQHLSTTIVSAPRAAIIDRNGKALALTVIKPSIFIIPARLPRNNVVVQKLSRISGISLEKLKSDRDSKKQFLWIKRQVEEHEADVFRKLTSWADFGGTIGEPARIYPNGSVAAQLIGYTGIDNQGLMGVERSFESSLKGEQQKVTVTRDARRRLAITFPNEASKPEEPKQPLQLALDLEVQRILEQELSSAWKTTGAKGASGVVLDVLTGELIALASLPTFDLNKPESKTPESSRLRPLQDALELGSVIKPMVVAAALDHGAIKANDVLDCENGVLKLPGATINDVKKKGLLHIADILRFSSNVCMYKIAKLLGKENLMAYFARFGLTEPAGTGIAGEYQGDKQVPARWREIRFANVSFGQGIAISPLQMASALATTIGSGERLTPRVLKSNSGSLVDHSASSTKGTQVVKPEVAMAVRGMLAQIVESEDATAPFAKPHDFSAGGKTGTAQKYSPVTKTYSERTPNFLGFFPAEHPRFVVYIVLDEVSVRPAWGGKLAAPVFSAVTTSLGRYLGSTGRLSLYSSDHTKTERPLRE